MYAVWTMVSFEMRFTSVNAFAYTKILKFVSVFKKKTEFLIANEV